MQHLVYQTFDAAFVVNIGLFGESVGYDAADCQRLVSHHAREPGYERAFHLVVADLETALAEGAYLAVHIGVVELQAHHSALRRVESVG